MQRVAAVRFAAESYVVWAVKADHESDPTFSAGRLQGFDFFDLGVDAGVMLSTGLCGKELTESR